MNSFIHTGFKQVVRRNNEDEISPNYTDEEILDLLESTNSFAILTAIAIADIADNVALANTFYDRGVKIFKKTSGNTHQQRAKSGG